MKFVELDALQPVLTGQQIGPAVTIRSKMNEDRFAGPLREDDILGTSESEQPPY